MAQRRILGFEQPKGLLEGQSCDMCCVGPLQSVHLSFTQNTRETSKINVPLRRYVLVPLGCINQESTLP